MMSKLPYRVCRVRYFVLLVMLCAASPAQAQENKPHSLDRAKEAMKEAVQRLSVPQSMLRSGPHVRSAFAEVVAGPRTWTARVKNNGVDTALGCVVGPDGWVLTKASRLKGPLSCRLVDGQEFDARLVGVADEYDLAMLKIDAASLPTVQWKAEGEPALGQWVASPGLDEQPVAVGVVSVAERRIAKRSGILGVMLDEGDGGPKIVRVEPDSGAARAGLQVNDIVTHCNDLRTKDRQVLVNTVRKYSPGEEIELTIKRKEKKLTLKATLTANLKSRGPNRRDMQDSMGSRLSDRRYGFPAVLQHDTVLRPEDCGGPIVDLDGHALGINVARAGRTASYAIPTATVQTLLFDLVSGKRPPSEEFLKQIEQQDDGLDPSPGLPDLPQEGRPPEPEGE